MIYALDIVQKFGGELLCGDTSLVIQNLSKDTRTIKEGDIYIGIKGENFDGNLFYKEAFDKGAKACILDRGTKVEDKYKDKTIILVDNTLKCLWDMAKYKREINDVLVVGITGSVGKTSTKEMVSSVLREKYKVLSTEGNNNNHIGVPLTILRLTDEEVMVIEMGMNNKGEIAFLSDIAKPTMGVITNIGTAHIGNLGSRENIMKAKLEMTENLSGPLIINNDNDMLHNNLDYIKSLCNVITVGIDNQSDYMAKDIVENNFKINGNAICSPINNTAFIYNSMVAYAVGDLCKIDPARIKRGIMNFSLANRLEYKKHFSGATLIDDTYNASLDSIKSSLELLCKEKATRRGAVIGDVLELGEYSKDIHREIGKALLASHLDFIVTVGEETLYTDEVLKEEGYQNIKHFAKEVDTYEYLDMMLEKGDVVLFKGSHGMNLKNIIHHLTIVR